MQNPFWVVRARAVACRPLALGNHTRALLVKEGRTGPDHARFRVTRRIDPLTRPETAKSASSQGGALALVKCEHNPPQTHLKDMKMEFIHD
jgi:hypothetical protein